MVHLKAGYTRKEKELDLLAKRKIEKQGWRNWGKWDKHLDRIIHLYIE